MVFRRVVVLFDAKRLRVFLAIRMNEFAGIGIEVREPVALAVCDHALGHFSHFLQSLELLADRQSCPDTELSLLRVPGAKLLSAYAGRVAGFNRHRIPS